MNEPLIIEQKSGVSVWRMNHGPVNALEDTLLGALDEALERTLADPTISCVVIGSDLRVFSAGADARWMKSVIDEFGRDELMERFIVMMDRFRALCTRLHHSRLVSIAALDGHVLAGGLELASACDLRFARDHDKIQVGVPEMKLFGAMPSGGGGVPFLTRILGASTALLFTLEGEPVTPRQAYGMRLVDRLLSDGSAITAATEFAIRVADQAGPIGLAALKESIMRGRDISTGDALALDRSLHWDAMRRGKFLDGVEGFARKFG